MIRSLFIAATGMDAQKINIDVISNNLANTNTVGFKRGRADFQDLMYQIDRAPGSASADGVIIPSGMQAGLGVKPNSITKIFQQGDFMQTGNPLDLVIEGDGFFQITLPDGTISYSRNGAFKLDADGIIVNSDGYPLEPQITIPADAIQTTISSDGIVSVLQSGQTAATQVGQIELSKFINPGGLRALGRNLFMDTDASGAAITAVPGADSLGLVTSGFLEMSNVNVVEEMVNMIVSQRAYEINSKAVQASDEMLQTANNLRR